MKTNLAISDDYAFMGIQGAKPWEGDKTKLSFYYGYEETDQNDEWLFVVKQHGKVIKTYTTKQLEQHTDDDLTEMSEYLLIGINMYLNEI